MSKVLPRDNYRLIKWLNDGLEINLIWPERQRDSVYNELIQQSGPSLWKCILNQIDETVGTGIQVKYLRWFKKHQTHHCYLPDICHFLTRLTN